MTTRNPLFVLLLTNQYRELLPWSRIAAVLDFILQGRRKEEQRPHQEEPPVNPHLSHLCPTALVAPVAEAGVPLGNEGRMKGKEQQ